MIVQIIKRTDVDTVVVYDDVAEFKIESVDYDGNGNEVCYVLNMENKSTTYIIRYRDWDFKLLNTPRHDGELEIAPLRFDLAIEQVTIKLNAALLAFRQDNKIWARERVSEAKATLRAIQIFTGRNITFAYNDLEYSGYTLIEDQYEKTERVIFESNPKAIENAEGAALAS